MMPTRLCATLGVALLATIGCDHATPATDRGKPISGLTKIEVSPALQTIDITPTTQARAVYTARGTFSDGHTEEVTDRVRWSTTVAQVGVMKDNAFEGLVGRGGVTGVVAMAGTVSGSATLYVRLSATANDPASMNVPADAATKLAGPASMDAAKRPQLVYPNSGALLPPNLGRLEVHFRPGAGNTLFEIAFANQVTDVKIYARCALPMNGGCIYQPDATTWAWIAETNRGGDKLAIRVRGTDDAGTAVGASQDAVEISFAQDDIEGGLYYWRIGKTGDTAIMRYDFGATTAQTQAEKFVGTEMTGGTCVGCHALSRDGTKLVAEAGGQRDGRLLLLDVAARRPMVPFASTPKAIFTAWSPDGTQYVGSDETSGDWNLRFYDGSTGALLGNLAGTGTQANPTSHPDWSPDGNSIAYVKVGRANTLQMFGKGAIMAVSRSGAGWGAPVEIVPAKSGWNHYYPAWSPDSQFLVYNESKCNSGDFGDECDADTNPTATLYAVKPQAGATPIALARANAGGVLDGNNSALTNSYPKWSPFVFQRVAGEASSRLMWITFASRRKFGLRDLPQSDRGGDGTLLWMAAIDPDKVNDGTDPSFTAFVLPFQDYDTSNHIAQWTTKIVPPIN
jgi:Tol biopolymer transport system component